MTIRTVTIPLERGVPIIDDAGERGVVLFVREPGEINFDGLPDQRGYVVALDDEPFEMPEQLLTVDLSDPLGFGYALRWLAMARAEDTPELVVGIPQEWFARHLFGHTTDDDRRALADALRAQVDNTAVAHLRRIGWNFSNTFDHAVRLANEGAPYHSRRAFRNAIALADNDADRALAKRYLEAMS